MIHRWCEKQHMTRDALCGDCSELLAYALRRLESCPFQEGKTTCGKCPVHCYRPSMREKIRQVMRHVGPRMLLTNPLLAVRHLIDGIRRRPRGRPPA